MAALPRTGTGLRADTGAGAALPGLVVMLALVGGGTALMVRRRRASSA
jgi:hypothetical protein